ncbi:MAG: twitching motility protein PilT [Deltaproteobacteria bacterium]|nr:twitching motility protein PilT [Deltaproteobacteria bacterium]MBW2130668.1 twitching motility protein PilT [Deltaproteobacteria bacterium]MBW2305181.1 twitching motility protein PilT [Deltaproteobacteria bacterium]
MPKAIFRFYEELNDFLPEHRRKTDFEVTFEGKRSIKDMIEALGVPHTEIDLILVNGKSIDFDYIIQDEDRVSVYPVFEYLNIENVTRLRKIPLRRIKFIADNDLGDIVKYLRMLGFDVYYDPLLSNREIIKVSRQEKRIILTRSKRLLKYKEVTHGIFVRAEAIEKQIKRIIGYLDIKDNMKPFSRCLHCNSPLESVPKEEIKPGFLQRQENITMNTFTVPLVTRSSGRERHLLK